MNTKMYKNVHKCTKMHKNRHKMENYVKQNHIKSREYTKMYLNSPK